MRKAASLTSIIVGAVLIIGGIVTWVNVSNGLAEQKITVSEDAKSFAGKKVDGPFTANAEIKVIQKHTLEATGGKTYAELDRKDPVRTTAATSAFLQASLYVSILAYGIAGAGVLIGALFVLIGLGIRDVAQRFGTVSSAATPLT